MLKCCALGVWGRHGPVSCERSAGREEGDFCRDPANGDVDGEVEDHSLDLKTECEPRVHYQHADFDDIDDVEHCLQEIGQFVQMHHRQCNLLVRK